jgi:hypothetical protein
MNTGARRMPLPNYAAMVALSGMIRKKLFGGYFVPMLPFATQGLLLFWEGAILGAAYAKDVDTLVMTLLGCEAIGEVLESLGLSHEVALASANDRESVLAYVEKMAGDGLGHYGRNPESLLDLFATSFAPPDVDFRQLEQIRRLRGRQLPAELAALRASGWFVAGMSLGFTHTGLATNLSRDPHGQREPTWWTELKRAGGIGPPTQEQVASLGTVETVGKQLVVSLLATYAKQYYPEIMAPLGLTPNE